MKVSQRQAVSALPWPEADRLFHRDPRWLGSDDAYTVPLSQGTTLWLFGDTFVGDGTSSSREKTAFPRNTIGLQEGSDPSQASIRFFWKDVDGMPSSFFEAEEEGDWLWPLDGQIVSGKLLLFFMKVRSPHPSGGGPIDEWRELGPLSFFDVYDWDALIIEDPSADPSQWQIRRPARRDTAGIVAGASVVEHEGWLYAFGWRERNGYLMRWPTSSVVAGSLESPEWWAGDDWADDHGLASVVLPDVKTEFTVHRDATSGLWCQTQFAGAVNGPIVQRWSSRLEGPWSKAVEVYAPEEADRPGVMVYASKAHPHLAGADLVLTYASNGKDADETVRDNSIYFPRFVRVTYEGGAI